MSTHFAPHEELTVLCRFCNKVHPAQLDRGIAGNGKTVDRNGVFEYCCSKCNKSFCLSGQDLPEKGIVVDADAEVRTYNPREHYFLGEVITHKQLKDKGMVVGKEKGSVSSVLIQFEKAGMRKLIESMAS